MISEAYLRRHASTHHIDREVALLDVAQEYVLEYLRREGAFDDLIVFKGGTALRKFVFGSEGRFSVDLDFGVREDDDQCAMFVLDLLDGANFAGVRIAMERRRGTAANLRLETPLGSVTEPAAVSIRQIEPWLPPQVRSPLPFRFLDQGLAAEFARAALPVLDVREAAAEKIAAFWRRRVARDLYDLDHLGSVLQATFDGRSICALAALKIYFDVVEERAGGRPVEDLSTIFGVTPGDVAGKDDLGRFGVGPVDIAALVAQCRTRYASMTTVDADLRDLVRSCSLRDRFVARERRDALVAQMLGETQGA